MAALEQLAIAWCDVITAVCLAKRTRLIAVLYYLMFTALWLNVAVPVTVRLWKPFYTAELAREAENQRESTI